MVDQDEAFFYHHDAKGQLDGMLIIHVDDFLVSGTKDFLAQVANSLKEGFDFGRIEEERFKYTGINIQQQENKSILIDQIEYIKEIEELKFESKKIGFLNDQEQKQYKSLTGKLLWAAEITRPDISFDVRIHANHNH